MNIYDFKVRTIREEDKDLSEYKGKVMLIVNTASKCGLTPQFKGLEELYKKYSEKGFVILGFPCGQFANQELEKSSEIQDFCLINYGVSFPIFEKIDVNGENAHPLFKYLVKEKSGLFNRDIKWNFTKFLVDKNGKVIKRFSPMTTPDKIEKYIKKLIMND